MRLGRQNETPEQKAARKSQNAARMRLARVRLKNYTSLRNVAVTVKQRDFDETIIVAKANW